MFTPELAAELESLGEVVHCRNGRELSEPEYASFWRKSDAAVTGWGVRAPTAEMLSGSPVKVIAHTAGSVRMFPREAIAQGILITTARAAIARTVAEYCLLSAMTLLRRWPLIDRADPSAAKPKNETLFGRTIGLVGYGCVGREFRELLCPFGCRVLVFDPFVSADVARQEQIELMSLEQVLSGSKVVSLHAPDIPETRGMIGRKEIALLQDGAVFVNSARGRLVDTAALTEALETGRFFAGLDVTDPEPLPADHPLRSMPNVLFTPHVAGPTEDDLPKMTRMALDDLKAVLSGSAPRYPVSLEAYDKMSF